MSGKKKKSFSGKLSGDSLSKNIIISLTPSPRIIAPYAEATLDRILLDLNNGMFEDKEKKSGKSELLFFFRSFCFLPRSLENSPPSIKKPLFVFLLSRSLSKKKKLQNSNKLLTPPLSASWAASASTRGPRASSVGCRRRSPSSGRGA